MILDSLIGKKSFEIMEEQEKNLTQDESIHLLLFSRRKITTGIDDELKIEIKKR